MSWLLTNQESNRPAEREQYRHLGLKDNPFPVDGIINRHSSDPRVNGTIFTPQIRQGVIQDFERKLLGIDNPEQRYRLGYFWSQGDQALGRGVGKTAILNYLQRQINQDWGESYFQGTFPVCALYVYPQPEMNKLEYISVLALQELVNQGVMDAVVINLRRQVALGGWSLGNIEAVESLPPQVSYLLLDNNWLTEQGFDEADLDQEVIRLLTEAGVAEDFATAIASRKLITYLKSFRRDHQLTFKAPPRDTLLYRKSNHFFFTEAILTLEVAGFKGVYLFIDDIENMIDKMSRREREAFAKELGYILLRGEYEASISRFVTVVLTTHAAAAQRLSEAWGLAGLQASLPMSLDAPNSILVPILSLGEAKQVVRHYLTYYQLSKPPSHYHPFKEEAVELVVQQCNYHPREFLARDHFIVEQAKQETERAEIDLDFVETCLLAGGNAANSGLDEAIDISLL